LSKALEGGGGVIICFNPKESSLVSFKDICLEEESLAKCVMLYTPLLVILELIGVRYFGVCLRMRNLPALA
jgi:hypothetical protein